MSFFPKPRNFPKKSFSQGFSLVEMLIYIFILVLLLSVIMNIVISSINSGRVIKVSRDIEDSALLSLERISREVRQASSVDLDSSVLGSSPGILVLEGLDINDNPRTVEFYLSSGSLFLKENGVELGALTQAEVEVTDLTFHLFSGPNSQGIRTEITLESGTSTSFSSDNFYSSTLLR